MLNTEATYNNLRKAISESKIVNGEVHGILVLTPDNLVALQRGVTLGIVSSDIVHEGSTVLVDSLQALNQKLAIVLLPKISQDLSQFYIGEEAGSFYKNFSRLFCVPKEIYITELSSRKDFEKNHFELHLKYAIQVKKILDLIQDYQVEQTDCFEYFIHATEPLIIQAHYQYGDSLHNQKVAEVLGFIEEDPQRELYKSFLRIQLISFLKGIQQAERFSSLLQNFQTIYLNFKNSVELYFRNYDYQKNKNELESKKVELAKKIHSVVNDIGGKVITIPAAYLLILKDISTTTPLIYLNIVYFAASVMFALIIQTSFSNQLFQLKLLRADTLEFLSTNLKSPELEALYSQYSTELNNSLKLQKRLLIFLTIIRWALPLSIIVVITCFLF